MSVNLPIDREIVKTFLPHRDPMLFIDGVMELTEDSIKAISHVDPAAPFFKGHFPDRPIMPGVLLIETVAQAGVLIVAMNGRLDVDKFIAFSGVEQAKFRRPVLPGDELVVSAKILRERSGYYKFEGSVFVGEKLAVELKFAATQMAFED